MTLPPSFQLPSPPFLLPPLPLLLLVGGLAPVQNIANGNKTVELFLSSSLFLVVFIWREGNSFVIFGFSFGRNSLLGQHKVHLVENSFPRLVAVSLNR